METHISKKSTGQGPSTAKLDVLVSVEGSTPGRLIGALLVRMLSSNHSAPDGLIFLPLTLSNCVRFMRMWFEAPVYLCSWL